MSQSVIIYMWLPIGTSLWRVLPAWSRLFDI